jgi:hypothetical protein
MITPRECDYSLPNNVIAKQSIGAFATVTVSDVLTEGFFTTMHLPENKSGRKALGDGDIVNVFINDGMNKIFTEIGKCVQMFEFEEDIGLTGFQKTCDFIFVALNSSLPSENIVVLEGTEEPIKFKNEIVNANALFTQIVEVAKFRPQIEYARKVSCVRIFKPLDLKISEEKSNLACFQGFHLPTMTCSELLLMHGIGFGDDGGGGLVWHYDDDGCAAPLGLVVGCILNGLLYTVYPLAFIDEALKRKNIIVNWGAKAPEEVKCT